MNMYIVRLKSSGFYLSSRGTTGDPAKARIYRRSSDASNSARHHFDSDIRKYLRPEDYEVIEWNEFNKQGKYVVEAKGLSNWKNEYFTTKKDAQVHLDNSASKYNLHRDYFTIREVVSSEIVTRPSWEQYFLGLAFVASRRSLDANTKHGCVIATPDHRVLGMGYNSFPKGLKDHTLPNKRPDKNTKPVDSKYNWMIHSEVNAVSNCIIRPDSAIAYVTGKPCTGCLMYMWQNGIKKIVYANRTGWTKDEETKEIFDKFVEQSGIEITPVDVDLSWLQKIS